MICFVYDLFLFTHIAMIDTLYTLKLSLLHIGYASLSTNWQFDGVLSPFSRLYLITEGEAWVYHNQQKYLLKPGYMYLIPKFSVSRYHCDTNMEQYYISFLDDSESGLSVFDMLPFVYEAKASHFDRELFQRLLDLHPGRTILKSDPKTYDNRADLLSFNQKNLSANENQLIETQGVLLQLVSRFIRPNTASDNIGEKHRRNDIGFVLRFIHTHLDKKLTVEQLAEIQGLNCDYFSRQFLKILGVRPLDYIINKRLERAKILITSSSLSLQEVADRVGIFDIYYFSKLFKNRFGIAPSRYRKQVFEFNEQ